MKHLRNAPDLSEWDVELSLEGVNGAILGAIEETLASAMADDDTTISFPVEWAKPPGSERPGSDGCGGAPVDDPLTIYLHVALCGGDICGGPIYTMNLRDAIKDTIETCAEDGSYSFGLGLLSTALRELADEIDDAIAKGERAEQESDT